MARGRIIEIILSVVYVGAATDQSASSEKQTNKKQKSPKGNQKKYRNTNMWEQLTNQPDKLHW